LKNKFIALSLETVKHLDWIKIGVEGVWKGHYAGEFTLTSKAFEEMVFHAKQRELDIVVDYEHETLWGNKAPASGWIQPENIKVENGELWVMISWTPTALEFIEKKEYKYLSPVFMKDTVDPSTGSFIGWTLHSVALTNTPFLSEIGTLFENKKREVSGKENEVATLKEQLESYKKKDIENKVDTIIAEQKLALSQRDWAIDYAKKDNDGFDNFVKTLIPSKMQQEQFKGNEQTTQPKRINIAKV
jgi:phage I-like protein